MLLWRHQSPDLVHRRRSHSRPTYHGEDLQGLESDQGTTAEQGQAARSGRGWRVGRCSPTASAKAHCTVPLGRAWPSLTFPEVLQGGQVAGAQVQRRIYLRGDPQKPKSRVFEQQVPLAGWRAKELEAPRLVFSKFLLIKGKRIMRSVVDRKPKHQVETEYLQLRDDSESRNLG